MALSVQVGLVGACAGWQDDMYWRPSLCGNAQLAGLGIHLAWLWKSVVLLLRESQVYSQQRQHSTFGWGVT